MVKSVYNTINHKQIKAFGNTMNSGAGAQQDLVCVWGHSHTRYHYHRGQCYVVDEYHTLLYSTLVVAVV